MRQQNFRCLSGAWAKKRLGTTAVDPTKITEKMRIYTLSIPSFKKSEDLITGQDI